MSKMFDCIELLTVSGPNPWLVRMIDDIASGIDVPRASNVIPMTLSNGTMMV